MVQVLMHPAADAASRRHWAITMDAQIPFASKPYRPPLTDPEFDELTALHGGTDANFWGAHAGHDKMMSTLTTGDIVLFTWKARINAIGEIGASFRNAAFADTMWVPHPDHGSFHNVYSVLNLQTLDVPFAEIWELPSFNHNDVFRQARILRPEQRDDVLNGLQIESAAVSRQQAAAEMVLTAALTNGTAMPVEGANKTTATYTKNAGQVIIHRAETLLVHDYISTLNGATTQRFRTDDGGIADLLVQTEDTVEVIEAKRSSERDFVRHALGQLLDYAPSAEPHAGKPADRLAVLVPDEPSKSVVQMLHRYGVDCIFRTAPGKYTRLDATEEARLHLRQRWLA
ncbi:hypothetical protein [Pseudonocardia alni]|uniref:hypothetical protein n=1 Tax=Pseudonocardia alni TaxID=33907 RepID=UPI001AD770A6|nr:hypothetical protein [Pseudonocardia alni]MBO4239800.1 hypothetical protein [Pseudonocardia alni]